MTKSPGAPVVPERSRGADSERGLHLLREMLRIRRFEERCVELYSATKIRGFMHLYIGEEAVAVGVMDALQPEDAVVSTYREHGHALARGIPARSIMAEMFGKVEGCSRGRGGSMHLFDAERRFYGGNAIVAGGVPLAVGLALADRMRPSLRQAQGADRQAQGADRQAQGADRQAQGADRQAQGGATGSGNGSTGFVGEHERVTVCFFGEGAVAEGELHESMNLAALWHLPVVFCCENNLYAMGTALSRSESETDLALKVSSYEVAAWPVDGMDVLACADAARRAVDTARAGGGPVFVEFRTYRYRAHSMYDPELYRGKEEVEQWKERDPIDALDRSLADAGLLTPADRDLIEQEVADEVDDAVAFADAGTLEPVSELARFVYRREVS